MPQPEQRPLFADDEGRQGAVFDETGIYRYRLWRRWQEGPPIVWIMLNPSTADQYELDPTLRRCQDYSIRWGFPAMEIVNLYAYRSTEPAVLPKLKDPVGADNLRHIEDAVKDCALVLVAWGQHARTDAVAPVLKILQQHDKHPHCLKVTKDGHPWHPLYLQKRLEPERWEGCTW